MPNFLNRTLYHGENRDFLKRCWGVNTLEGKALNDGYIIGRDAEYYGALARRRETHHQTRWANDTWSSPWA